MKLNALYVLSLVLIIWAMGIGSMASLMGERLTIPLVMLGVAFLLYQGGNFLKRREERQIALELEKHDREAKGIQDALNRFVGMLGFDSEKSEYDPRVARLVEDGKSIEVGIVDDNDKWTEAKAYSISDMSIETFNGHTMYYKKGEYGFIFLGGYTESALTYFA